MTDSLLGTRIGHYRVVDHVGTGGMGDVYVGYDETLERRVALKWIRPEHRLDGEAKARLLREARALSQLGHPNICQIYDYLEGETSDVLVLELIEGRSLKRAMKKGLNERLKMVIAEQVAGVLVAAHEKGVVHRDLKPDNVMLTQDDQVKVLDFGLSRRLSDDATMGLGELTNALRPGRPAVPKGLGEDTLAVGSKSPSSPVSERASGLTTAGTIMGTLGYMSPEQARGEVATAASDMYSFGLLIQELFTGRPPFVPEQDAVAQLEKARLGETVPVSGLDPDLTALIDRLKSPELSSRPSAQDAVSRLAWIRQKPIRRRNKLLLSVAAMSLVLFSIAMAIQSVRATRAERRAKLEAETAKQVSGFLVDLFKVSDPGQARGASVTARELLDRGAKKIGTGLESQPRVQARLLVSMGMAYVGLGLYLEAEPLLTEALKLREKASPADPVDVADSLNCLAILYQSQGKFAQAEPIHRRALSIQEAALGPDHRDVGKSLSNLAILCLQQGKFADAAALYKRALAIQEKALGPDDPDVAAIVVGMAIVDYNQGKYAEAEPLYERALAIQEKALGPEHPHVAVTLNSLAVLYYVEGKYNEAEPLYKKALAIQEKALGPDHPRVATTLNSLAVLYADEGRLIEAEAIYKRAIAIWEKALGPDHPDVATALNNLGDIYASEGRYAEAAPVSARGLAVWEKALGPDHPHIGLGMISVAAIDAAQGRYAEAAPLLVKSVAIEEKALGPEHPYVAVGLFELASLRCNEGRCAEAEPFFRRALAIREKAVGDRSQDAVIALKGLAWCECRENKLEDALARTVKCIEVSRELSAKMPENQKVRFLLGASLLLKGRVESAMGNGPESQASWREALAVLQPMAPAAQAVADLAAYAQTLLYLGKTEEARPVVKRLRGCGYVNPDLDALCKEKGLK